VAENLENASSMAGKGKIKGARDLLTGLRGRIRESVVFRRPLGVHLVETVDESLDGLQDKVRGISCCPCNYIFPQTTFSEHGAGVMRNYIGSHWQQRSAMKPSMEGYRKSKMSAVPKAPAPPPLGGASSLAPPTSSGASPWSSVSSPYRNTSKEAMIRKHKK